MIGAAAADGSVRCASFCKGSLCNGKEKRCPGNEETAPGVSKGQDLENGIDYAGGMETVYCHIRTIRKGGFFIHWSKGIIHTFCYTRSTHFGTIFMYIYGNLREKARDDGTTTDPVKSRLRRYMEGYGEI